MGEKSAQVFLKEMRSKPTTQIARDLGRDYDAVLNFVHKGHDASGEIDDSELCDVCEANEIYVTAGEKGIKDEDLCRQRPVPWVNSEGVIGCF